MKMLNYFTLAVIFLPVFFSCSDNDDDKLPDEVAVKTVKAISCIDLSDREDWLLRFGYAWYKGNCYNYAITDRIITGSPKSQPFSFGEGYKEGDILSGSNGRMYIRFVSPGYFPDDTPLSKMTPAAPPAIEDQSTLDKLVKADALFCQYTDVVTSDLTNLKLIHENNLLDFETVDIPAGTVVRILGNYSINEIIPYRQDQTHYKVVILSKDMGTSIAVCKGNNILYAVKTDFNRKADRHYTFTLRFDNDKESLVIEDLNETVWSEES